MGIKGIVKRNRVQSFVICLVICLAALWASINTVYAQAGAQQKKAFLWSLKTDKATIYLLGSFHLLKSDAYPLDKDIEAAYRDCQRVVFETDIDAANDPAFQARMLTQGLYPEGQTLEQNISKETYSLLEKKLTEVGLTLDQVNRFKPWRCALTVAALKLKRMGFDPQYGIDGYFFNKAKKDGKEKLFLESLDSQIALFSELGGNQAEAFLRQTLKDLEVVETMLPDMVGAWETGDAARLESIMTTSFKDYPDIYDRFIVQRNRAWAGTIEQLLAQGGTTLVVVGAGHLVGPENVLQLLKNKGYNMEQITAHAGVSAITPEGLVHALYIRSGMEEQIWQLPLAMQGGLDQARIQDDRIQQIPQDVYINVKNLLAEAFAAEHLNAIVLRQMEVQLGNAEMERIRAWLDSPLGKRCSDLFTASLKPQASTSLQEFMENLQKSPASPARLELIQGLASATKAKDVTLEIAVDTQLVLTTVISTTFPSAEQWPFSKILDETEKNRLLFEPRMDQLAIPLLLYMYSTLSDAELGQYLAFAKSGPGARYYRALFNGIRLALMDASIRFGAAMADLQWKTRQLAGTP
jgi:uncharacterized protein YbaP (TraB family)